MANRFPPQKDGDLATMATQASAQITLAPTTYSLTVLQASTLAGLVISYTDALAVATEPTTRTRATISTKDVAKKALVDNLRDLNRYTQANKSVTDAQKIAIQFPVYASRTPINPPTEFPTVTVDRVSGRIVRLRLMSPGSERRGRPVGVQGAIVLSFTGATPPADPRDWTTEGLATRTQFDVTFAPSVPAGSRVWLSAAWYSPRGQAGPLCPPVECFLAGGVGMGISAEQDPSMKMAA